MTECNGEQLEFHGLGRRAVVARFDGGAISTDGGALLLREVEAKTGLLAAVAEQFSDHRDPELIEHTAGELVSQRILALALGYADLNDHDRLRVDPLLAVAAGKRATPGAIRTRLLKVGAQVRVSVRRVVVALSDAFPAQDVFVQAVRNLAALPAHARPG